MLYHIVNYFLGYTRNCIRMVCTKLVILDAIEDTKLMLLPERNQVKLEFKNMMNVGGGVGSNIGVRGSNRLI